MNTIDDLRTALDDAATPSGIDLGAVRHRARRQRGWTAAGAALAVIAVTAAVTLPLAIGGSTLARPVASPTGVACPDSYPRALHNTGPGLDDELVPTAVDSVVACEYHGTYLWRQPAPPPGFMYLIASRELPLPAARALLATMEQASTRRPDGCAADRTSVLLQVTGGGRTIRLRVDPYTCGLVSNGSTTRYAGRAATVDLPALLSRTPTRSSCPDREPLRHPGPSGPADRLVPFRPDYVLLCTWSVPGVPDVPAAAQEAVGPDARRYVEELERLPTTKERCIADPGSDNTYLVIVLGQGHRATLFGGRKCFSMTNGRRTVNWSSTSEIPQLGQ